MDLGFSAMTKTGPIAKVKKFIDKDILGAMGGDKDEEKKEGEGGEEGEEGEDPEITAARKEAEDKRAEKHKKMEEERETMRQGIRDKYGIKKKEIPVEPQEDPMEEGRIGRKKKTPAEMAAEMNAEEDEDSNEMFPKNLDELKTKVSGIPGSVMTSVSEATEKCVLQ